MSTGAAPYRAPPNRGARRRNGDDTMGWFTSSPKGAATKSARDAARGKDADGPETKYVVKYRARVPLVDAGQTYTTGSPAAPRRTRSARNSLGTATRW
jgi:hypothetical protein